MAGETQVTVIGRITREPEVRYMNNGDAAVKFSVAVNARTFSRERNEWVDKPTTFWDVKAFDQGKLKLGENVGNVLKKGDSVIVSGEIETREWEQDGQKRRASEIRAHTVGKDLRFHSDPATQDAPGAWNPPAASSGPPAADGSWTPASTPAAPQSDTWGGWGNTA
ncbi:single-stranded DNA-binding protein [Zhihengliuella halotolerans]|uniref:single-stranded DNA-binding protein n=1 Tax=Zhihengliuella halotolerans TaxID=370736 RepID=UPI0015E08384|nr:single-stranded DNA-binding protein [Zhihengliuella halotolerans]